MQKRLHLNETAFNNICGQSNAPTIHEVLDNYMRYHSILDMLENNILILTSMCVDRPNDTEYIKPVLDVMYAHRDNFRKILDQFETQFGKIPNTTNTARNTIIAALEESLKY